MRRALTLGIGTLIVLGGLVGLLAVFSARDDPGLGGVDERSGPGRLQRDRGASHDADAPPAARLATSGAHRPRNVTRDATEIGGDALLHALEAGNVVLAYGGPRPPSPLRALQREVAGPFDAEIAAAGQAVVLARVPGLDGIAALAWRRLLRTKDPGDPALRDFAEAWLGAGAPG